VLIRDGAYDSLPKTLRAAKHQEVARWAEGRAGDRADELAELIATHEIEALRYLDELGDASGRAQVERDAYRWARAAGDRAAGLWLTAEAVRWYADALRIADELGLPSAERASLARDLARMMFGSHPSSETEQAYRRALGLFEEAGDDLGAGWAESWLVLPLFQQGRDDEALASGRSAIARLAPLGDTPELADAYRLLGQFHWRRGHSEEADESLRQAIAVTDRVDAPVSRASAMQDLGIVQSQTGHSAESLVTLEEAFELAKVAPDRVNLMRIHNNFASTLVSSGSDYRRAREIGLAGLELAQKAGGGWAGWIQGTLGDISFALGDFDDAETRIRSALEYAVAGGDEPLQGQRLAALAQLELTRGDVEAAVASTRRADEILEGLPEPQVDIYREETKAVLALTAGRDEDTLAHLRAGVRYAEDYSVDGDPQVVLELVRFLARRGGGEEADHARRLLHSSATPLTLACATVADGLLASDPEEAVALLRTAAGRFEQLGTRVDHARALLDLGRAERRAGGDPRSSFERARQIALATGALLYLPEADAELSAD